jgi:hypothetical protein
MRNAAPESPSVHTRNFPPVPFEYFPFPRKPEWREDKRHLGHGLRLGGRVRGREAPHPKRCHPERRAGSSTTGTKLSRVRETAPPILPNQTGRNDL